MRRAIVTLTIAALMLISTIVHCAPAQATLALIVVPDDFPTIKQAVQNATDGDTILIRRGVYNESQILIDKAITLRGEDTNQTVIYGKLTGIVIEIRHEDVTVTGLSIYYGYPEKNYTVGRAINYVYPEAPRTYWERNFPKSMGTSDIAKITLAMLAKRGDFDQSGYPKDHGYFTGIDGQEKMGIFIYNTSSCQIVGNRICDCGLGIRIYDAANNTVVGNEFVGNDYGIYLNAGSNSTIIGNTFRNGGGGICFSPNRDYPNNYIADQDNANTTVVKNNFIGNSQTIEKMFLTDALKNSYDNGAEGNYWGQSNPVDSDTDGIVDAPRKILGEYYTGGLNRKGVWIQQIHATDNYPLAEPYDTAGMFIVYQAITPTPQAKTQPPATGTLELSSVGEIIAALAVALSAAAAIVVYTKKRRH